MTGEGAHLLLAPEDAAEEGKGGVHEFVREQGGGLVQHRPPQIGLHGLDREGAVVDRGGKVLEERRRLHVDVRQVGESQSCAWVKVCRQLIWQRGVRYGTIEEVGPRDVGRDGLQARNIWMRVNGKVKIIIS